MTLTGPGGLGKTRLALEVAAGLVTADGGPESWLYPDGAWLVDLAPSPAGRGLSRRRWRGRRWPRSAPAGSRAGARRRA